jgi:purine-binding chemotaxis protein CheW
MKTTTALTFTIGRARLALEVALVREVLPMLELVRPPEIPGMLRGFVNLEGRMIPVLRLEHLLQLNLQGSSWEPEGDPDAVIVIAEVDGLELAWMAAPDPELISFAPEERARLPKDHVLNNCAEYVIARQPPEPSIVLLAPARLLLEAERQRLAQLAERERQRLAEV